MRYTVCMTTHDTLSPDQVAFVTRYDELYALVGAPYSQAHMMERNRLMGLCPKEASYPMGYYDAYLRKVVIIHTSTMSKEAIEKAICQDVREYYAREKACIAQHEYDKLILFGLMM